MFGLQDALFLVLAAYCMSAPVLIVVALTYLYVVRVEPYLRRVDLQNQNLLLSVERLRRKRHFYLGATHKPEKKLEQPSPATVLSRAVPSTADLKAKLTDIYNQVNESY